MPLQTIMHSCARKIRALAVVSMVVLFCFFSGCTPSSIGQKGDISFCIDSATAQQILGFAAGFNSSRAAASVTEDNLKTAVISVSLKGDYEETKTKDFSSNGVNLSFNKVPIGAQIFAQAEIYYIDSNNTKVQICSGESDSIVVQDGKNSLSIDLTVVIEKAKEEGNQGGNENNNQGGEEQGNPEEKDKNVNYTVEYWLQNIDDDEYTLSSDTTLQTSFSGIVGKQSAVEAASITGFTLKQDVEQITLSENASENIVKLYYLRNEYTITYDSNSADSSIKVPEPITARYGKVVELSFDIAGSAEGSSGNLIFDGWKDSANNKYTSGRNKTLTVQGNDTLKAVWIVPGTKTTGQVEIQIETIAASDIQVVVKVDGTQITPDGTIEITDTTSTVSFVADSGYTNYTWKVNNVEVEDNNTSTLSLAISDIVGVCDITLLANKVQNGENIYHSYSAQIKKIGE